MDTNKRKNLGIVLASISLMVTCAFSSDDLYDTVSKDSTPPTLVLSIPAPTGKNGWYNKPVFVKAIAFDEGARKNITAQVSLGGTTWYDGALMIRQDGFYLVKGKAIDRSGNVTTASALVKVDMTPPDVQFTYPAPDGENGYYVNEVPIVLTGSDALSGVVASKLVADGNSVSSALSDQDTLESFSDENVRDYQQILQGKHISTETVHVSIRESGIYDIQGYVEDEAGNQTPVSTQINVDRDAPQISIDSPKEYQDDIQLFGDVRDFDSGVARVMVDYGSGWKKVNLDQTNWTIVWPAGDLVEGKYPIRAKAFDLAGNEMTTQYTATVLNTVWPFITMSALLITVALFFVMDPRRNEWVLLTKEINRHKSMYKNGLELEVEEEYLDD